MISRLILAFLLIAQPSFSYAEQRNKNASTEEVSEEKSAPKVVWLTNLQKQLPTKLCQAESYFVRCFELDSTQCQSMTQWFAQGCLTKMAQTLPESITPEQGEEQGKLLGRCVYDLYNLFLKNKKIDNEECPPYIIPSELNAPSDASKPSQTNPLVDPTQPGNKP